MSSTTTITTARAVRSRRNKSSIHCMKLLLSVAALTANIPSGAVAAFSPEIFNQIIVQLGTAAEIGKVCPDELAFAAANLLDIGQRGRKGVVAQVVPLLPSPPSPKTIISIPSISIPLPKLAPSIYNIDKAKAPGMVGMLDLTPPEEELIQLILKVRNKCSPRTTIRIAGGWVRDKLIYGQETPSRDVDLVLSDISGIDFATKVCKYVEEMKDCPKHLNIQMNVHQESTSKGAAADELQNANLLINGFDVDFCRLRSERYDDDSRIPTSVKAGTVVEDAWRRDLTINALYYNVNSNQVEDFTERGIRDLIVQTIDTPLKPLPTLLQDPTRILRAIRFAAQLSFDMSPELVRAARDDRVHSALQYKVSRDAIGKAIDEMLGTRARDPVRGIQLLMSTNLISVVFPLGEDCDPTIYNVGLEYLSRTQSLVTRIFVLSPDLEWDISKRRLLWYAAFLKPVHELLRLDGHHGSSKRKKRQGSPFHKLMTQLRRPKSDEQSIENILKGVAPILAMLLDEEKSDAIGFAIRSGPRRGDLSSQFAGWDELSDLRWSVYSALKPIGPVWKEAVILALASSGKTTVECVDRYTGFLILVEDRLHLGTTLMHKPRPLLDGSQIQKRALRGKIDGRDFKRVVQATEEWQIRNVFHDIESMDDEERSNTEARLIDHLVATFPEYANCTQA